VSRKSVRQTIARRLQDEKCRELARSQKVAAEAARTGPIPLEMEDSLAEQAAWNR
jgi:hypothetical protein